MAVFLARDRSKSLQGLHKACVEAIRVDPRDLETPISLEPYATNPQKVGPMSESTRTEKPLQGSTPVGQ